MMRSFCAATLVLLLASSCRREDAIETYRVPKESAPEPVAVADPHAGMMPAAGEDPHAGMGPATGANPHEGMGPATGPNPHEGMTMESMAPAEPRVKGEVPAHWELGKVSAMRLASYMVSTSDGEAADVSLATLGGGAGGDLDNVNRWRGQIGLPPVEAIQDAEHVANPLGEVLVVDLDAGEGSAKGDGRIIAGILPRDGETWFFKMRGDRDLVGREKAAFLRWIETAKPVEP